MMGEGFTSMRFFSPAAPNHKQHNGKQSIVPAAAAAVVVVVDSSFQMSRSLKAIFFSTYLLLHRTY